VYWQEKAREINGNARHRRASDEADFRMADCRIAGIDLRQHAE
jgi:hypothetical protein